MRAIARQLRCSPPPGNKLTIPNAMRRTPGARAQRSLCACTGRSAHRVRDRQFVSGRRAAAQLPGDRAHSAPARPRGGDLHFAGGRAASRRGSDRSSRQFGLDQSRAQSALRGGSRRRDQRPLRSRGRFRQAFRARPHLLRRCFGRGPARMAAPDAALSRAARARSGLLCGGREYPHHRALRVEDRLALLGFVADEEIADVMAAADLLLHPARADTTGTVILEAVVNGLPVVTTAVCGYAGHVREADAGAVIPKPFAQRSLLAALGEASDKGRAAQWSANAMRYGERPELYSGLEVAADIIVRGTI